MSNRNSNVRDTMENFHDQKQLLTVQMALICKKESDYFKKILQENNLNNTNRAEVEYLKQTICAMRDEMNGLKNENSSLKIEKDKLSNEHKTDAKRIKCLDREVKSLNSKMEGIKLRHAKEVKKLNSRLNGKEKTVKYLREKYEVNKISDMMSQKMSTRSSQHRLQTQQKPFPNKEQSKSELKSDAKSEAKSPAKSSDLKLPEVKSEMKDDEEDESLMLASPQASQDSQGLFFGDDLTRMLNSDTQQTAAYGTPTGEVTWSDEE